MAWQIRSHFSEGRSRFLAFTGGRSPMTLRHWAALFGLPAWMASEAGLGVLLRNRKQYPYWQNYYYEVVFRHLALWAKVYRAARQNSGH